MASSGDRSYSSSLETANFARICRIVVDLLRDILWQLLTHEILPTDLPKKVQTDIKKLGKLDLKIKTWLCGISPSSAEIPSAEQFDVSSLYTLIRNLCSQVPTPSTQWGQIPPAGGITLGDDIERVREFRNTLYGHATLAKIETQDFDKLCIDIKNVVSRFDVYFCSKAMKCDFKHEIDTILTCSMDKSLEDDYIDKMKEIAILSDDLDDVKLQVSEVKMQLGEVKHEVGEVKHQVDDVKVKIGSVDQQVGDIKKNLEIVQDVVQKAAVTVNTVKNLVQTGSSAAQTGSVGGSEIKNLIVQTGFVSAGSVDTVLKTVSSLGSAFYNIVHSSLPPILPDNMPTERQLGRISVKIGYKSVLGQALGLSEADIQQIQKVYPDTATQCLMICFKWKLQSGDNATFRNLEMALKRADIDADILISLNKAGDRVSCLPPDMLSRQPEDKHLNQISSMVEAKHVHLGVELEVPLSRIEQILTEHLVDVHRQCFEIMKEWRQRQVWRATFNNLEKAFICIGINPDILKQSLE